MKPTNRIKPEYFRQTANPDGPLFEGARPSSATDSADVDLGAFQAGDGASSDESRTYPAPGDIEPWTPPPTPSVEVEFIPAAPRDPAVTEFMRQQSLAEENETLRRKLWHYRVLVAVAAGIGFFASPWGRALSQKVMAMINQ